MGATENRGSGRLLGRCPSCDAAIPSGRLLIEYESAGGWPKMFAECPRCADVVHPL